MSDAAAGRGRVVAVLGEAGVGKTSLLNEAMRRSRIRTIATGCEALFTPRPLGPLYDIGGELKVDLDGRRERLFPAVLAEVSRKPTLLIVGDVHWADRATLDLLKYLARRIDRTPVLLAISYRDDESRGRSSADQLAGRIGSEASPGRAAVARSCGEARRISSRSLSAHRWKSVLRHRGARERRRRSAGDGARRGSRTRGRALPCRAGSHRVRIADARPCRTVS